VTPNDVATLKQQIKIALKRNRSRQFVTIASNHSTHVCCLSLAYAHAEHPTASAVRAQFLRFAVASIPFYAGALSKTQGLQYFHNFSA